eukprot:9813116-Alexandrium_andersonii.AAC.1
MGSERGSPTCFAGAYSWTRAQVVSSRLGQRRAVRRPCPWKLMTLLETSACSSWTRCLGSA